jgi:hypothetical protein
MRFYKLKNINIFTFYNLEIKFWMLSKNNKNKWNLIFIKKEKIYKDGYWFSILIKLSR